MLLPGYGSVKKCQTRVHVLDDLFGIVINARLGREIDLTARAYSDNYIIDLERKLIYSPGRDREAFTDDDIHLSINPDVIGFQ